MADKTDLRVLLHQVKNSNEEDGLMKMIIMMKTLTQNILIREHANKEKRGV